MQSFERKKNSTNYDRKGNGNQKERKMNEKEIINRLYMDSLKRRVNYISRIIDETEGSKNKSSLDEYLNLSVNSCKNIVT